MTTRLLTIAFLTALTAVASADPPAATNPAATTQATDAAVDQVLDALHARGQGLKDFVADVSMDEIDNASGDTTTLKGKVWYQGDTPEGGRIRVLFDNKKLGERQVPGFKLEYLLDKGWLVERDFGHKLEVLRQVLKPGQKMNLLKLGEGPFPLPIGQPREDVYKLFVVKKPDAAKEPKDAPADAVHIQLTPKPKTQFARKFKTIDIWVDNKTSFPRRVETVDPRETSTRVTDLSAVRVNAGLGDKDFALPELPAGWQRKAEAMGE